MRAAEELRSALIFRAIARASRTIGFAPAWPPRFMAAMRDEIRHAKLCAFVGAKLGAPVPSYDPRPVRARLGPLADSLARAAALLLVEVAMGETISMSLFRAGRQSAVEPLTRAALTAILADEVRHQQLGWTACQDLWPTLSEERRQALQREATLAFAAFEQQNAAPALRRLGANAPFDPAYAALGVLSPEARVEAFYSAVEGMVLPRLSELASTARTPGASAISFGRHERRQGARPSTATGALVDAHHRSCGISSARTKRPPIVQPVHIHSSRGCRARSNSPGLGRAAGQKVPPHR
jgi:hypothetical protein